MISVNDKNLITNLNTSVNLLHGTNQESLHAACLLINIILILIDMREMLTL